MLDRIGDPPQEDETGEYDENAYAWAAGAIGITSDGLRNSISVEFPVHLRHGIR